MSPGSFFLIIPGLEMNPSHQIVWSLDDDDGMEHVVGGSQTSKSYTCAFCKRGFSNAQALGGHMNIHRKDRAKLKEAAEDDYHNQTLLSLDISGSSSTTSASPPPPTNKDIITASPPRSKLPETQDSSLSSSSSNIHQQPLFVDHHEERVDLELRLGPEPPICESTRGFL